MSFLDKVLRRKKSLPARTAESIRGVADQAGEVAEELAHRARDLAEQTRDKASDLAEKVRGHGESEQSSASGDVQDGNEERKA